MIGIPSSPNSPRALSLPVLLLLFVGSGCAALIYEVVWFQLLQLIIGSSAVSLGVLLGTFMGGMCLGSFLLPRILDGHRHPLRVYAALELGIGLAGLLLLWGMPFVNSLYAAVGASTILVRAVVAVACLLPPTVLMGATLPAVARWVEATPQGVAWLGFFYGGNIAGAVVGSLLGGLYLLRLYDVAVATYAAVALNVVVAAVAAATAGRSVYRPAAAPAPADAAIERARGARLVYWTIALSGLTALSSQVVWTRLLSLLFGGTVYTFSLILAVFLFGLGIGSTAGAAVARGRMSPRVALGWSQLLLSGAMAWAAYLLMGSLPFTPISDEVMSDPVLKYGLDLWRCAQVVLPAAFLWGASFPLALASVLRPGDDPGRLVGGVYAANTLGAIAGSLGIGLFLIAYLHSQHTQQMLIVISAVSGLLVLVPGAAAARRRAAWSTPGRLAPIAAAAIALVLAWLVPAVPGVLVAYGRYSASWVGLSDITYVGEGLNAFVAVSRTSTGVPSYHNSGKVQASSEGQDMRLQRMLGHFSHLIPTQSKDVLVVGLGAGVTAGAVAIAPSVERVTVVEIEPLVPTSVAAYFGDYNYRVVDDPKVTVHIDDGRHYLLTTDRMFDVITSDPLDPWIKGAATLFTEEFFEEMKRHLNPGGVVTQFVQLYGSNSDAVRSEIGTFMKVFPHTVVFGNLKDGQGYDLVLVGRAEPISIDVDALQARLEDPAYARVAASLREIGIASAVDLLGSYAGSAEDLAPWLSGAVINTDRNLRLQYLAGLTLNAFESGAIYLEMLQFTRFPERLFTGSPESLRRLRERITRSVGSASAVLPPAPASSSRSIPETAGSRPRHGWPS
jgi:spermidine synthase